MEINGYIQYRIYDSIVGRGLAPAVFSHLKNSKTFWDFFENNT